MSSCSSKWLHHFPFQARLDEGFTVELSSELRPIWLWNPGPFSQVYQVYSQIWAYVSIIQGKVLVAQSCPTLCNPMGYSPPDSSVHGILQDTGVGFHSLLQGIFLAQGRNLACLPCRQILYHLSCQRNSMHESSCEFVANTDLGRHPSESPIQETWSRGWQSAPVTDGPRNSGWCWSTQHSLRKHAMYFTRFSRENPPHPQTETSGILTGKWLHLTNANIWLIQLFLYHHYLWML